MEKKRKLIGRMVQVVFRIPPEAEDKLRAIAKRECRSYSSVLRQAITEWLAKRPELVNVRIIETPPHQKRPRKSNQGGSNGNT